MVDNFKLIFSHLSWPSADIFYWINILQRRKDGNPELGADNKLLRDIYIDSPEKFWAKEQEIKEFCKFFNARAYIYLNQRNTKDVALECLALTVDRIIHNAQKSLRSVYATACGRKHSDPNKKWVIDVDTKDVVAANTLAAISRSCRPDGVKVMFEVPTPNGVHLITTPFDLNQFQEVANATKIEYSVQKFQPTVLFAP